MASPLLESLRATVAAMPPGALVPRDWLLEQLSGAPPAEAEPDAAQGTLVDLTIGDLARLFGKRPSTVRAWVERGDFPGAYKLHGKQWRVTVASVESFQNRQRRAKQDSGLSAWRKVERPNATKRSETGHEPVTTRSPRGIAEV